MSHILDTAHKIFDGRNSVKKDTTKIKNLAEFFSVDSVKITDEFLLNEILKFKGNRIIQETEWRLEKDFEKRTWYEKNKDLVNSYPEFVRSTIFQDQLPQIALKNLSKPADKSVYEKLSYIETAIKVASFAVCDFGRKQRTHYGDNIKSDKPLNPYGRTVNNGRYSSRCYYPMYDYYADYTCLFNEAGTKVFYRLADGTAKVKNITKNGWVKIEDKVIKPPQKDKEFHVKPHHRMRVYSKLLPKISNLRLEWDSTGYKFLHSVVLIDGEEKFHLTNDVSNKTDFNRLKLKEAIKALRKRRKEKIAEAELKRKASRTFVSYDDSRNSGNCHDFTLDFARKMWQKIGAVGECAVRADLILAERSDSYTKRAVNYAINRSV